MDLSKLNTRNAAEKAADIYLRNPYTQEMLYGDDEQPIVFKMLGFQSTTGRNTILAQKRRKNSGVSEDQLAAELLAALCVGWSNNFEVGGEKPKFSKKEAEKLFLEEEWIAIQCSRFAAELGNFNPEM
mgnify:CR=1 FL=1